MADSKNSKISELTELIDPSDADFIPIVDTANTETKKISYSSLITSLNEDDDSYSKIETDALLATIQADVDQNESDADTAIAAVQADVDQNESDADTAIAAVQADVDQNEADADAAISALQADVDQNESDADAAIAAVQADVDQNESDADAAIAVHTASISQLQDDTQQNGEAIGTNVTNIATNVTNIATNVTNIATNTSNIATNTSNIATNTSNISSNTSSISTNAANINTKAPIASPTFTGDVAFKAQSSSSSTLMDIKKVAGKTGPRVGINTGTTTPKAALHVIKGSNDGYPYDEAIRCTGGLRVSQWIRLGPYTDDERDDLGLDPPPGLMIYNEDHHEVQVFISNPSGGRGSWKALTVENVGS